MIILCTAATTTAAVTMAASLVAIILLNSVPITGDTWLALLRHERKHLAQIERDGRLQFSIKYTWWTLRHGYWNNPYEVEARAAESKTT